MKEIGWKAQTIAVLINFHYINVYILVYISFTPSQSGSFPTLFFQSRAKVKAQQQHANTTISSLQLRVYHIFLRLLPATQNNMLTCVCRETTQSQTVKRSHAFCAHLCKQFGSLKTLTWSYKFCLLCQLCWCQWRRMWSVYSTVRGEDKASSFYPKTSVHVVLLYFIFLVWYVIFFLFIYFFKGNCSSYIWND